MITIRWAAFVVALVTIVALCLQQERTLLTAALAALLAAAFITVCWSYGAFDKSTWIADEETSARLDRVDQELDRLYGGGRR
ncbi:hypothetical protein [Microbacterium sp. PAMC21962]|uniref:hypothetical protein n=1 Tax=Microbacterium sp. PAMC21962 TaxID=2861280 RepID=UPI001C6325E3|nr:hypothetical protein [Microbacterium sp. PAMC21962]QYF98937.1 hypothetical protein KY498_06905 [Microbacterium sp. PAMC21962]